MPIPYRILESGGPTILDMGAIADGDVSIWRDGHKLKGLSIPALQTKLGVGPSGFEAENKDAVTIKAGQQVTIHSSGTGVILANATDNSKNSVGVAVANIAVGFSGRIQTGDTLSLANWTDAMGAATLGAKAIYWLDTTSGKMTTSPPSTVGKVVQRVGYALDDHTLMIEIEDSILL